MPFTTNCLRTKHLLIVFQSLQKSQPNAKQPKRPSKSSTKLEGSSAEKYLMKINWLNYKNQNQPNDSVHLNILNLYFILYNSNLRCQIINILFGQANLTTTKPQTKFAFVKIKGESAFLQYIRCYVRINKARPIFHG